MGMSVYVRYDNFSSAAKRPDFMLKFKPKQLSLPKSVIIMFLVPAGVEFLAVV